MSTMERAVRWFVVLFVLLYLTACEAGEETPRAWPTAHDSAVAACSPLCRITAKCAGMDLGECESSCVVSICLGVNCDEPSSGTDAQIDACLRGPWDILYSDGVCSECVTYSDECLDAMRP